MDKTRRSEIIDLVNQEVVPALGCTEPIAVALTVAAARQALPAGESPVRAEVKVSPNIYKNGMGVGVPGTGMIGLEIAAALACFTGDKNDKLEVLHNVTPEIAEKAKAFAAGKNIDLKPKNDSPMLYVEAKITSASHVAVARLADAHTNIIEISLDDNLIYKKEPCTTGADSKQHKKLSVAEIYEFATTAPLDEIEFIREAANMNDRLSQFGLESKSPLGLGVGESIAKRIGKSDCADKLLLSAMARTAAASDARMAGAMLPAMSNSGSGNQGITVTMPIVAAAEVLKVSDEKYIRALMLGSLISVLIKQNFGKLSGACGCVVASTGAACGITYLLGGNCEQIAYAIKNMTATLTGMICDGAKPGCALKVASGTSAAVQSAYFAIDNICASATDGIIAECVEQTIANIGNLASNAMLATDKAIIEIMVNK